MMITKVKSIIDSPAISKSLLVTVGVFLGSIFSYLLQIFLGRWLSIKDFGSFTALLSLSVVLGVLITTSTTSLVKLVSSLSAKGKLDTLTELFIRLSLFLFGIGFVVFSLVFFFKGFISDYFSLKDSSVLIYFGIFLGISFINPLSIAYLQGLQRFKAYSFYTVLQQFLRFFVTMVAVMLGFGLAGAFLGMGIAVLLSFLAGILILRRNFTAFKKSDLRLYYKSTLSFASSVFFVQIGMTLLNNVDVILVKHFFDAISAGLYAGLVTIGKVLLFGASTVGVVMFPMIAASFGKKENYLVKFKPLLTLQLFVVFCGVLFFSFFPELITKIMFGPNYLPSAKYLSRFSLFVGSYVLINFMILFFLAIERVKVFLFLIPAILAQIILISIYNNSIENIININLGVSFALLLGVFLYFAKVIKEKT